MREATVKRKTKETDINLTLSIDGTGRAEINSGCGFLDHMLTLLAGHGGFDITLTCTGDTCVDDHHTTEDIGIALGQAISEALGDRCGITRYGDAIIPMDEALILSAVDISGRGYLGDELPIPTEKVGTFDTELVKEFWLAFTRTSGITLHIRELAGENSHHIIEGAFKSVAHALRKAVAIDCRFPDSVPSTKGTIK